MSRLDREITIRWGVIFAPLCWLFSHRTEYVHAGTWADLSGYRCRRCGKWVAHP